MHLLCQFFIFFQSNCDSFPLINICEVLTINNLKDQSPTYALSFSFTCNLFPKLQLANRFVEFLLKDYKVLKDKMEKTFGSHPSQLFKSLFNTCMLSLDISPRACFSIPFMIINIMFYFNHAS